MIPFIVLEGRALCRRDTCWGEVYGGELDAVRRSKCPPPKRRVGCSTVWRELCTVVGGNSKIESQETRKAEKQEWGVGERGTPARETPNASEPSVRSRQDKPATMSRAPWGGSYLLARPAACGAATSPARASSRGVGLAVHHFGSHLRGGRGHCIVGSVPRLVL